MKSYSWGSYHSLINLVLVLVLYKFLHHVPWSTVIVTHTMLRNMCKHNIFTTGLVFQFARKYVNGIVILVEIIQHKLKSFFISSPWKLNSGISLFCLNEQHYIKYSTMLAASWLAFSSDVKKGSNNMFHHFKNMCNEVANIIYLHIILNIFIAM